MIRTHAVAAVAAGLLIAAAGSAAATGLSTTVSVGGSAAAGTHGFTGVPTAPATLALPALSATCTSATIPAAPVSTISTGVAVTDIATITKVNFVGCASPGGSLVITSVGSWQLHATGGLTSGSTDVVAGHVDKVVMNVTQSGCAFTVTGKANSTFSESHQRLRINQTGSTPNLIVSSVSGCFGTVGVGQPVNMSAELQLNAPGGPIDIG